MNFYAEMEKSKQQHLGKIGQLSYEHYDLFRKIEDAQKRMADISQLIAKEEAAIAEADQSQRNFNTYLAVKENALTLNQIKQAVEGGTDLNVPPAAVEELKPAPEAKRKAKAK